MSYQTYMVNIRHQELINYSLLPIPISQYEIMSSTSPMHPEGHSQPPKLDHLHLSPPAAYGSGPSEPSSASSSGSVSRWRNVFKMGKGTQKSKDVGRGTILGSEGAFGDNSGGVLDEGSKTSPSTVEDKIHHQTEHDDNLLSQPSQPSPALLSSPIPLAATSSNHNAHLGPPTTINTSGQLSSSSSDDLNRPYSAYASSSMYDARSSASSSSRQHPYPLQPPTPLTSVQSPYGTPSNTSVNRIPSSGSGISTPHKSPSTNSMLGLGAFKSRFFSTPNPSSSTDLSPDLIVPQQSKSKKDKYKGLGKSTNSSNSANEGSSSTSSFSASANSPLHTYTQPSPITPAKTPRIREPPPSSSTTATTPAKSSGSGSPEKKSSAAVRFLRRVASAPNAKALFGKGDGSPTENIPPVPIRSHTGLSPSALVVSDPISTSVDIGDSPTKTPKSISSKTNSPRLTPNQIAEIPIPPPPSTGPPVSGGRNRALTAGSGTPARVKEMQSGLGIGSAPSSPAVFDAAPGGGSRDSHHKQVFRRTYSSNSIKTRSVSDST